MFKKYLSSLAGKVMDKVVGAVKPMLGMTDDAGKTGAAASGKIAGTFSEAADSTRIMKGMAETGLVSTNPKDFVKLGTSVLQSPHGNDLAGSVARSANEALRRVVKDDPASRGQVEGLLKGAHTALDKNIARRTQQAKILQSPEELGRLHTRNLHDARAIFETGAPAAMRQDAARDMARDLGQLAKHDHATAAKLRSQFESNPELKAALNKAERDLAEEAKSARGFDDRRARANAADMSEFERAQAQQAATPTPAAAARKPTEYGPDGNRDERLRNLGVTPERRPSEFTPPVHQYDEGIARAQATLPTAPVHPSRVPTTAPQNRVELDALQQQKAALSGSSSSARVSAGTHAVQDQPEVSEVSMDLFRRSEAEFHASVQAQAALARAASTEAAPAVQSAVRHTFQPTKRGVTPQ
jgi:hypothetical protein